MVCLGVVVGIKKEKELKVPPANRDGGRKCHQDKEGGGEEKRSLFVGFIPEVNCHEVGLASRKFVVWQIYVCLWQIGVLTVKCVLNPGLSM